MSENTSQNNVKVVISGPAEEVLFNDRKGSTPQVDITEDLFTDMTAMMNRRLSTMKDEMDAVEEEKETTEENRQCNDHDKQETEDKINGNIEKPENSEVVIKGSTNSTDSEVKDENTKMHDGAEKVVAEEEKDVEEKIEMEETVSLIVNMTDSINGHLDDISSSEEQSLVITDVKASPDQPEKTIEAEKEDGKVKIEIIIDEVDKNEAETVDIAEDKKDENEKTERIEDTEVLNRTDDEKKEKDQELSENKIENTVTGSSENEDGEKINEENHLKEDTGEEVSSVIVVNNFLKILYKIIF